MTIPPYARVGVIVLAVLSAFWLPWVCTLVLMTCAGFVLPLAALSVGILADLLYYPGHGFLWGTVVGIFLAVFCAAVRHFVKTRIM